MGEWFNNLSLQEKILYAGGGVLVLLLLFRSLGGANSTSSDAGVLGDQSQATAAAETAFEERVSQQLQETTDANSKAIQDQTAGILAMFSGFQDMQTKSLGDLTENLSSSITSQNERIDSTLANQNEKLDSTIANQTEQINTIKTSLSDQTSQIVDLLGKMSTPNYYGNALPPSSGGSTSIGGVSNTQSDTRPTVTVVPGSADEKILKVQYGDTIKYNYSSSNQFGGKDREVTNGKYQDYLGGLGVAPKDNAGDLYQYGKGLGE